VNLNITVDEGPQYHMGKLEIIAAKETAARVRAEWKLPEGDVYDTTYVDRFLDENRDLLPAGFSRASVETIQNCPDALVEVRLILDQAEAVSRPQPKDIPCEDRQDKKEIQR
jgi:outer membrane protein assembly factor BamA